MNDPKRFPRVLGAVVIILAGILVVGCMPIGPGMMRNRRGRGMMGGDRSVAPPAVTPAPTATPGGTATVSYRQGIQPIFNRSCVSCHGGQADLYLDSYDHALAGGANGPVIIPGDPQASELYRRITGQRQPSMPLGGPSLSPREIDLIRTWITEGAPNN